jgi:hypothetical protein
MLFPKVDEQTFKERVKRLQAVNAVISKLDETIRADAYELLKPYIADDLRPPGANPKVQQAASPLRSQAGSFNAQALVDKHESAADTDNVFLCLAIFHARHGRGPFTMRQLKAISEEFDLAIPDRHDNTLRRAKRGTSKTLVVKQGSDGWKITPGGETWLKSEYEVTRGREPLTDATT